MRHTIVPPYLLRRLADLEDPAMAPVVNAARRSLALDPAFRQVRVGEATPPTVAPPRSRDRPAAGRVSAGPKRTIFDAANSEKLPGRIVRREGAKPGDDAAVNEAYDGLGKTYTLFRDAFGRASIDGDGLPLLGTVHYGTEYDNAFWDGKRMVFGDGDGMVFTRFTASLSVIGHELSHGVTQFSANLTYQGQSGALNESISDVFGALVEQHSLDQTAKAANWLIGVGLFTDQVQGRALRSMKSPGTAYDDDVLGTDPQPASMEGYVVTKDDNGGVHLNSGIPNRAFYLAADAIGGRSWEGAGRVWYDTITTGTIPSDCDFAGFAAATSAAASARFGGDSTEHRAVIAAWTTVGVLA